MKLTAEYLSMDTECQLFRIIPESLQTKIERSVNNLRKRKLFTSIEFIKNEFSFEFNEFENYSIINDMLLGVAKIFRSSKSKIRNESFYSAPNRGYCTSQKMSYCGYKTRILLKINAVTIIQYINKFIFNRNINNLNISIFYMQNEYIK